ncbi:MAG TPA: 4Fe-4S binding protein, partial [Methanoregula sp.]|nr:4Fe-4S binding protein [Methanoregula sp.]
MNISSTLRRSAAALLLTAGLAYPACAAVCPKGIGGCTAPGRCFLFTDADGNALCDYTGRTSSQITGGQAPATPAAPVPTATVTQASAPAQTLSPVSPSPDTTAAVTENASLGNFFDTLHLSPPVTAAILFLVTTGILYAIFRSGPAGIRIDRPLPALGLSSFLSLGLSLMAVSLLSGTAGAGMSFALVYMGAGSLLAAGLWFSRAMTRRVILRTVLTSTLTGFVFLSPIMPLELGGLVNVLLGLAPVSAGIMVILAVLGLALVAGRTFCGSVCPVGSVQELAYAAPVPKLRVRHRAVTELIRLAVFSLAVIAAVYLIDLLAFTGLYD